MTTPRASLPPAAAIAILALILLWVFWPRTLFNDPWSLVMEDRNGALLGARIAADGQWRFPMAQSVPAKFAAAIMACEDRRFRFHPGVDPLAMARAVRQNIRAGKIKSGGSTLSMQVIRLSRHGRPRSVPQKIVETALAFRLELTHRKRTILLLYAAHAPFGGNVVGLEAAAWRYFGRPPDKLSWAETASLAVLPNEPALVHPGRNRQRLLGKRDRLLRTLCDRRLMDSLELKLSLAEPLLPSPQPLPRYAPRLLDRIYLERLKVSAKTAGIPPASFRVRTSVDLTLQERVENILARHHVQLAANAIHNAAALVLDVNSGQALVYAGNVQPADGAKTVAEQVDIITAPRSTGSVLKPLLYAAMLDRGEILPTTLIPDIPTNIGGFTPQNFDRSYEGAVPAYKALARSLNVPAVRMVQRHGVARFHALLRELGMSTVARSADHYGISIILGGVEGTLWELTGIYASLSRSLNDFQSQPVIRQRNRPPCFFPPTYLFDRQRPSVSNPEAANGDALSAGAAWCALQVMVEVVRPGEEGAWKEFSSSRKIAWKTGTSFGFRDGWAIGCTPRHAIGVWVGNATGEGRPGLIGIQTAAPILFDILTLFPQVAWFGTPEMELRDVQVCAKSGYQPGPHCEALDTIVAPPAGLRMPPCPYHQMAHLDKSGRWQVNSQCESVGAIVSTPWFVLPPAMETYYRENHLDYRVLPPFKSGCRTGSGIANLGLIYPAPHSAIFVPREIDGSRGRVIFQATHRDGKASIFWHLDQTFLGATSSLHEIAVDPEPGNHQLVLVDQNGERLERNFTIIERQ